MEHEYKPRHSKRRTRRIVSPHRIYYYSWGKTTSGKNFIRGPSDTAEDAWTILNNAKDIQSTESRVIPLQTRDLSEATRVIKSMDVEETKSFEQGLRRARHID